MKQHCYRQSRAEISRERLIHNLRALRSLQTPGELVCPMVKCNAYGHNAVFCGQWLFAEGVDAIGVALVEEGIALREGGIQSGDILVFGVVPAAALSALIDYHLVPVVSSLRELTDLAQRLPRFSHLDIHLKFDTGMNRLGLKRDELTAVRKILTDHPALRVVGVCSHLACAEDIGLADGMSSHQVRRFAEFQAELGLGQVPRHLLNSTGLVGRRFLASGDQNWSQMGARPGIALYGCFDDYGALNDEGKRWVRENLRPVMTLQAELVMIKKVEAGERVSYGATWQAERPGLIGIAAVGYGDGYPRLLSNKGAALIHGCRVPVIGRVCMDYTVLDLSSLSSGSIPREGDLVTFFGDSEGRLSAVELAQKVGTISYEILTGISARVPRIEIG